MVAFLLMFGVFGPLFILPKGKQHGSFSISLFTQLYGLNFINVGLLFMIYFLIEVCFIQRENRYFMNFLLEMARMFYLLE